MGLEGALQITLGVTDERIRSIRVRSTRPDLARKLLQGRSRTELAKVLPRLFSVCARSQPAAGELACIAAAGELPSAATLARHRNALGAEIVREGAWRTLLDWPVRINEAPGAAAVGAARGSLALIDLDPVQPALQAIAMAAFGMPADDWLALDSLAELDCWIAAGTSAVARFIRQVCADDEALVVPLSKTSDTPLLIACPDDAAMLALSQACDDDPEFSRHPTWRGAAAETGALARWQADPLLIALRERSASRMPARFVARLRSLAHLLAGRVRAEAGAVALPWGGGIAWVENARGLLVHQVRLDADQITCYRIVAPTEWNFHPDGSLASALIGAPALDLTTVKRYTEQLVHSLDPCVACHVEIDDA